VRGPASQDMSGSANEQLEATGGRERVGDPGREAARESEGAGCGSER
jgi:hypothetical protein